MFFINRKIKNRKVVRIDEKTYTLGRHELVEYISLKYREKFNNEVTPLKLQKSLYFLFGYWVIEQKIKDNLETTGIENYLFKSNFQAWQYGPVDIDIYHNKTLEEINPEINPEIQIFLDEKLDKLFHVTDFTLVNLSHTHDCWKDNYDENDYFHNVEISEESIEKTFLKFL